MKHIRDNEKRKIKLENQKLQQSIERNQKTKENFFSIIKKKSEIDKKNDKKNLLGLDKQMVYLANSVEKDMNISLLKQTVV